MGTAEVTEQMINRLMNTKTNEEFVANISIAFNKAAEGKPDQRSDYYRNDNRNDYRNDYRSDNRDRNDY
jgi:hypothetical protein